MRFFKRTETHAIPLRVPPGQKVTERFPVLHYGPIPDTKLEEWDFSLFGLVNKSLTLNWNQFLALPQTTLTTDIHCVTGWSKLDTAWTGVKVRELVKRAKLKREAKYALVRAEFGYTANLPLEVLLGDDVILAHSFGGQPLAKEHGWPLRLVVPKRFFWKSAKWVRSFEFLAHDRKGFWEHNGYHNEGDPWKEERYSDNYW